MYLCNVQRLALGLEGTPDPDLATVQAAVTKHDYKGYVSPEYVAPTIPEPLAKAGAGGSSGGTAPASGGTHP